MMKYTLIQRQQFY